ncbi:MAG: hypothetical protein DMG57_31510 [Acidobacteria bacterium]|nr:MAG: hypothetical protein DMG57_31510 [Acidobacteriota bacterium]
MPATLEGITTRDHDEFGRYRNALRYGDVSLGACVDGLRRRGLDQKTLWIVLGDHGEAFGEHDGNYGHTFQLYDENVRVPFLVAAPGLVPQQIRSHQVVSLASSTRLQPYWIWKAYAYPRTIKAGRCSMASPTWRCSSPTIP